VPWRLLVGAGTLSPPGTEVAHELAGLAGMARARADQVRRAAARVAEPLARLLTGPTPAAGDLSAAFATTGLPADIPVRVVLARPQSATRPWW
jgi:hypothetical protein